MVSILVFVSNFAALMNYLRQTESIWIPKIIWVGAGFLCVALGILGLLLPLMPGLVFFILASFCFAKGSRRFLKALLSNPQIGPQIMDWKRGKGMLFKTKVIAIILVLVSMGCSALFLVKLVWVKWCIACCAVIVTVILLSVKTKK